MGTPRNLREHSHRLSSCVWNKKKKKKYTLFLNVTFNNIFYLDNQVLALSCMRQFKRRDIKTIKKGKMQKCILCPLRDFEQYTSLCASSDICIYVCLKVKAVCFILMWHISEWIRIFNKTKCRAGFDFMHQELIESPFSCDWIM